MLSRVTSDVYVVGNSLTGSVASVLKDGVSLIVLMVVAFYQDWMLALIAIVVFPASVLPMVRLSKRMRGYARSLQGSLGVLTALLQETVQGNRVVKAFGMEALREAALRGGEPRPLPHGAARGPHPRLRHADDGDPRRLRHRRRGLVRRLQCRASAGARRARSSPS